MADGSGMAVLIVEDETMIAFDLADAVEETGGTVAGIAADVAEGLSLIARGEPIDLAILDINLADEKSYPIADRLAEQGIPFIFVTGQNGEVVPTRFCSLPICLKPMPASAVLAEAMAFAATMANERA